MKPPVLNPVSALPAESDREDLSTLKRATALHQRGELAQAEALYREILASDPRHFDALQLLGVVHAQKRAFVEALVLFDEALQIKPDHLGVLVNRGNALSDAGRPEEALASFDRALALRPNQPEVLNRRGRALSTLERFEEAVSSFDAALATQPSHLSALKSRAAALIELGRKESALDSYDRALALDPQSSELLLFRSALLLDLERPAEALHTLDSVLAAAPESVLALYNRGNALTALNRTEEALEAYERVVELDPASVSAHLNRGNALRDLRCFAQALRAFDRVLELDPRRTDAQFNRGNVLWDLERTEEALESYAQALRLDPKHARTFVNRGLMLSELGRTPETIESFEKALELEPDHPFLFGTWLHAKMRLCDWNGFQAAVGQLLTKVERGDPVTPPFPLLAMPASPVAQRTTAAVYAAKRHPQRASSGTWHESTERRIRVGYFSADFRIHPVACLIAGVIEQHDRERFEVIGFSFRPCNVDAMRTRLEAAFDEFLDVRAMTDADVTALARSRGIDIAVDLGGFTLHNRTDIFAARAAPVQVNYLGYPGSMGAPYIDYIIGDRTVIPGAERQAYAEKVAYLPHTFQANDLFAPLAASPPRRELGLPENGVVFCSFSNSYKLNPEVCSVWVSLLHRVADSVLWLVAQEPAQERNLVAWFRERDVPADRLIFAPRTPYPDHVVRYQAADLVLDTWPFNGGATTSDALRAGVPVVTFAGRTFAGRMSASLLNAIGLPGLVTNTPQAYEALAFQLATDRDRLHGLRSSLADFRATKPLFDTMRFARHLEAAFEAMHARSRGGLEPEDLRIEERV